MSNTNSFSHLTLEERRIILTGITNGSTKAAIAQTIGKDKSTVGKEIKLHRTLSHKCNLPLECSVYRKYVHGCQCTPLLKQGLSPYQILKIHSELGISVKTMYNYIEGGVFHEIANISALNLRRQVSRRIPKKAKGYKKGALKTNTSSCAISCPKEQTWMHSDWTARMHSTLF